jgi:hypothetical protein
MSTQNSPYAPTVLLPAKPSRIAAAADPGNGGAARCPIICRKSVYTSTGAAEDRFDCIN